MNLARESLLVRSTSVEGWGNVGAGRDRRANIGHEDDLCIEGAIREDLTVI